MQYAVVYNRPDRIYNNKTLFERYCCKIPDVTKIKVQSRAKDEQTHQHWQLKVLYYKKASAAGKLF